MDGSVVGGAYAAHLTDTDLTLLASAAGTPAPGGQPGAVPVLPAGADAAWLRRDPAAIPGLLGSQRVFEAVFGWGDASSPPRPGQAVPVSPFLTFAVAVHQVRHRAGVGGPCRRADRAPAAGAAVRCARPARLPRLAHAEAVPGRAVGLVHPGGERPLPGPRRRPDPDPAARWIRCGWPGCWTVSPQQKSLACTAGSVTCPCSWPGSSLTTPPCRVRQASVAPLASRCPGAGRRARAPGHGARYRAARASWAPGGTGPRTAWHRYAPPGWDVVADVAGRFQQARRVLNHIADRYLFAAEHPWFVPPAP